MELVHTLLSADSPGSKASACEALEKVGPSQLIPSVGHTCGAQRRRRWSRAQDPRAYCSSAGLAPCAREWCPFGSSWNGESEGRRWAPGTPCTGLMRWRLEADSGARVAAHPRSRCLAREPRTGCFRQRQQAPERCRLALRSASCTERQRQRGVTGCRAAAGAQQGDAADEGRMELVHTPLSAVGQTGSVARRSRRLAPRS